MLCVELFMPPPTAFPSRSYSIGLHMQVVMPPSDWKRQSVRCSWHSGYFIVLKKSPNQSLTANAYGVAEGRTLGRKREDILRESSAGDFAIRGVYLDADEAPSEVFGGAARCAAPAEWVYHDVARVAPCRYAARRKPERKFGGIAFDVMRFALRTSDFNTYFRMACDLFQTH